VQVESEVGKGTTFRVYLPACADSVIADADKAATKPVGGGRETILVVEDEVAVRELICQSLAAKGYHILQAASGAKALDVWRQHQGNVDLLLTDLVMPDRMNGRELAGRLWTERRQLKVIFATGYGMEVAGKEFALRRGENFLQKPFSPQELARAVRECLDAAGEIPN
jgi:two-component system cell cycle sensor histidine kinase/response regulator CckA